MFELLSKRFYYIDPAIEPIGHKLLSTQCSLCNTYIADGRINRSGYSQRFVFRYDLMGWICTDCDLELGYDDGRIEQLMIGNRYTRDQAIDRIYGGNSHASL
jgi:hypothetical protein